MRWLWCLLVVAATSALAAVGRSALELPDVEMLYLVGVVVVALWQGRAPAALAAVASVTLYDYFFVEPLHTLHVADGRFLLTFAMMLGVGLLVGELAERLRRQQRLAAVRESRAALLSSVSHDLRTPLAAITGAATTLRDEPGLDEATRRELLESVCDEAERLERLVGNLLDMTRLERGAVEMRREWMPFDELVGAALARVEPQLAGRAVRVSSTPDLPLVPCDPLLLEQLLINLLDNAAKHTAPGSPIDVRARAVAGLVIIEVADRGPGLPPNPEPLFEPFARRAARGVPGAGLGLAICRGIAGVHGGTLTAESRLGGGALFRLTLPLDGPPPPDETRRAAA